MHLLDFFTSSKTCQCVAKHNIHGSIHVFIDNSATKINLLTINIPTHKPLIFLSVKGSQKGNIT